VSIWNWKWSWLENGEFNKLFAPSSAQGLVDTAAEDGGWSKLETND
jgi:hypothetical protein